MSDRHAYLIMAHNQPEVLNQLLRALDYAGNDIYLHLDAKMDVSSLHLSPLQFGTLSVLEDRLDVKWGDFSQIACELLLLEQAVGEKHAYYHLLSGVDLPLKPQREIHRFFAENRGTEFVQFYGPEIDRRTKDRVGKYHFVIRRRAEKSLFYKLTDKVLLGVQIGVDRTRDTNIVFQKGANWFSITDELARYVLSKKEFVKKHFRYSLCGDEMFLQTIIYNSEFIERVVSDNYCDNYRNILYQIDWKRGNPYEYTLEDYKELMSSGMLFARKFNWDKDKEVICKIVDAVTAEEWYGDTEKELSV